MTKEAPRPATGRGASLAPRNKPTSGMGSGQLAARGALAMVALISAALLLTLGLYSHLQHTVAQAQLTDTFRAQLAEGTAPVSEGTFDEVLLADGAPVARITIPKLKVNEIVVEGTSSTAMRNGPGHRRDTVLPGQRGASVIMGRMSAYGGPFGGISKLRGGDEIKVVTGQGELTFKVVGVRYAGDPAPPLKKGGARLQLLSATGKIPLMPEKVVRVDADLEGDALDTGLRQTGYLALPASNQPMASDTSEVWALVFALQFLVIGEIGFIWAWRRLGPARTWVIGVPVVLLATLLVGDQVARLLPNLT